MPLILKPGSREPWTPLRLARAFQAAGIPPEAVSLYPSDHAGAAEVLVRCGRSILFGDDSTLRPWRDEPRVQLHGPGWSKVLVGEDRMSDWESILDLMVTSVSLNGGRSCVNASGVWVPSRGDEVARIRSDLDAARILVAELTERWEALEAKQAASGSTG